MNEREREREKGAGKIRNKGKRGKEERANYTKVRSFALKKTDNIRHLESYYAKLPIVMRKSC